MLKSGLFFCYEYLFIIFVVKNNKYLMLLCFKNICKVNNMFFVVGFKLIVLNICCKDVIFLYFEEYEVIWLCDYEMKI